MTTLCHQQWELPDKLHVQSWFLLWHAKLYVNLNNLILPLRGANATLWGVKSDALYGLKWWKSLILTFTRIELYPGVIANFTLLKWHGCSTKHNESLALIDMPVIWAEEYLLCIKANVQIIKSKVTLTGFIKFTNE